MSDKGLFVIQVDLVQISGFRKAKVYLIISVFFVRIFDSKPDNTDNFQFGGEMVKK